MENFLTEQRSFAIFTMDATQPRWWQIFLKKPFWHVLVIHAYVIDGRHFIQIQDPIIEFSKLSLRLRKCRLIEVDHWYSYLRNYRDFCMQNNGGSAPSVLNIEIILDKNTLLNKYFQKIPLCTTFVAKQFMVVTFALTPFQLYKKLKNKGCTSLF